MYGIYVQVEAMIHTVVDDSSICHHELVSGIFVLNCRPCHCFILSPRASLTSLCCFTIGTPRNFSDVMLTAYMLPQPPLTSWTYAAINTVPSSRIPISDILPAPLEIASLLTFQICSARAHPRSQAPRHRLRTVLQHLRTFSVPSAVYLCMRRVDLVPISCAVYAISVYIGMIFGIAAYEIETMVVCFGGVWRLSSRLRRLYSV